MEQISQILQQGWLKERGRAQNKKDKIVYPFQLQALYWWEKLKIEGKPPIGFFQVFKKDLPNAERAGSYVADIDCSYKLKLFYWAYHQFKKNGRITF